MELVNAHLKALPLAQILVAAYQSVHLVDVCPCYAVMIENQNAQILVTAFQSALQVHLVVVQTCFAVTIEKPQNQNVKIQVAVCQIVQENLVVVLNANAQKLLNVKMLLIVYQNAQILHLNTMMI